MRIDDFTYDLPDDRIARYPVSPRDASRLLVFDHGEITHKHFRDLSLEIPAHSLMVFNDARVIPARAEFSNSTGARIEIFLLQPELPSRLIAEALLTTRTCVWNCLIGNKKKWKPDEILRVELFVAEKIVTLNARLFDCGQNCVQFEWDSEDIFLEIFKSLGEIPLPPYLKRRGELSDESNYQTIYAATDGAVAAPTAGLHFTEEVIKSLGEKSIIFDFLTLHVSAGTFQPIKVEEIRQHAMHSEQVAFTRELIRKLLGKQSPVIAVGTTSMRSLESLYWFGVKLLKEETADFFIEKLYPYSVKTKLPTVEESLTAVDQFMEARGLERLLGSTEIFIFPGYRFKVSHGLITNFHQPGSTLILLVAALTGKHWKNIYNEALATGYRFLSYGDSSLLWRNP